jgi:GNAT superfamily N-acetyltransferase
MSETYDSIVAAERADSARSAAIEVKATKSWRDRRRFQRLPWTIYAGDANWVPPILSQERLLLGWGKHPFFDHAEMVTLLALREGKAVGRVAVFVNRIHNDKYEERRGFFGFFECVDDVAVARALFDAGRAWLLQRGMTSWRGPVNPSLNYTCGLLVDGFTKPPVFLMTYNRPYYAALIEACGFAKAQDLYAYEMDVALLAKLVDRYKPAVMSVLEGSEISVRRFDPTRFDEEIRTYLDLYNQALEGTWGFTPLQEGEVEHIAKELKHVIAPEFAAFAMVKGRAIGAVFALLDYNQIIRKIDGRLLPFGFIRLMLGQKRIDVARAMAVTMVPEFQQSGLGIVLLDRLVEAAKPWGLKCWEFSWVLESNASSRGTLRRAGTVLAKTYRIYDRPLRDAEPARSFRRSDRQPNAQSASARITSPAGVPTGMAMAPGGTGSTPGAPTGTPVP